MEYNDLINKQNEFISIISHEIKSPIANAIFQVDGMLDDIKDTAFSREDINRDLTLLNTQLIKAGELLSKLFSVQYFDSHSVTLFREKVQVSYLIETELEVAARVHENISFINEISPKIGFISIDRIQFQQVISNILGNAVKFVPEKNPTIRIRAEKKNNFLIVEIEDNGNGFDGIEITKIFDRYTTGKGTTV